MSKKNDKKTIAENSIDLNQYPVLKLIDEMIALQLKAIEKYKELKRSLFIYKLTNEEVIYEIRYSNDEIFYLNEENKNKLINVESFYTNFTIHKHEVGKIRLKSINMKSEDI